MTLSLDALFGDKIELPSRDDFFQGVKPLAIQLGDYNRDGFQDLALVVRRQQRLAVRVLKSIPCSTSNCKQQDVNEGRRTFEHDSSWDALLDQIPEQIGGVSWIDVDEDVYTYQVVFKSDERF